MDYEEMWKKLKCDLAFQESCLRNEASESIDFYGNESRGKAFIQKADVIEEVLLLITEVEKEAEYEAEYWRENTTEV